MPEVIIDGSGGSDKVKVDSKNRFHTFSVIENEDKSLNKEGKAWSLFFTTTPAGANDYFFILSNTGSNDIAITNIKSMCAAAETILIEKVIGTPSFTASADITPSPKNLGSSNIPTATIKLDTDITGLISSGVLSFQRLDTADREYLFVTSSNIIIPQGSSVALKATTGTNLITSVVSIVEFD